MLLIAGVIFAVVTVCYGAVAAAIFYHLQRYAFPGFAAPRIAMALFVFASLLFWLSALFFFLRLPRNAPGIGLTYCSRSNRTLLLQNDYRHNAVPLS